MYIECMFVFVCVCVCVLKYNLTILILVCTQLYSPSAQSLCSLNRLGPFYSKLLDPPLIKITIIHIKVPGII